MLPAFRVRGVRPVEDFGSTWGKIAADGIIRMKKEDYDDLLKRQPEAALRYLDEDDGEVILVGSGFELDQRLKEPIGFDSAANISTRVKGDGPMHTFEVERQPDVVELWKQLDVETQKQHLMEQASRAARIEGKKTMTPTPNTLDVTDRNRDIRFGQASPLYLNAPMNSNSAPGEDDHVNRWTSYVALPSSFDQKPHALYTPTKQDPEKSTEAKGPSTLNFSQKEIGSEAPIETNQHNLNALEKAKAAANQMSKMELKSQVKSPDGSHASSKDASEHQPLLKIFESDLQKLASSSARSSSSFSSTGVQTRNSAASTKNASTSTDSRDPNIAVNPTGPLDQSSSPEQMSESSREIFQSSLHALLTGLNLFVAGLSQSNTQLKGRIEDVYRELSRQLESTFKNEIPGVGPAPNATLQVQGLNRTLEPNQEQTEKLANTTSLKCPSLQEQQSSAPSQNCENNSSGTDGSHALLRPFKPSQASTSAQWKVERIIGKRYIRYNSFVGPCIVQYLVRWVGCGPSEDMWYDEENLLDCRDMIQKFDAELVNGSKYFTDPRLSWDERQQHRVLDAQKAAALHVRTGGDSMVVWKERCLPGRVDMKPFSQTKDQKVTFAEQPPTTFKDTSPTTTNSSKWLTEAIKPNHSPAPVMPILKNTLTHEQVLERLDTLKASVKPLDESQRSVNNLRGPAIVSSEPGSSQAPGRTAVGLREEVPPAERNVRKQSGPSSESEPRPWGHWPADRAFTAISGFQHPQGKLKHRQSWHSQYPRLSNTGRPSNFSPGTSGNSSAPVPPAVKSANYIRGPAIVSSEPPPLPDYLAIPRRAKSMTFNSGSRASSSSPLIDLWSVPPSNTSQQSTTGSEMKPTPRNGPLKNISVTGKSDSSESSRGGRKESETAHDVLDCADSMVAMGYTRSQAETAATEVGGDLIKAIDLLEEDRKAWETESKNKAAGPPRTSEPVPGSWDEELYG